MLNRPWKRGGIVCFTCGIYVIEFIEKIAISKIEKANGADV